MSETSIDKSALVRKLIELVLACICMGLNVHSEINNIPAKKLVSIVFGAYIIIISGMAFGLIIKEKMANKLDMFFSLVGMALFVAAGSMMISYFKTKKFLYYDTYAIGVSGGSLAIINSFILLIDSVIAYKNMHE